MEIIGTILPLTLLLLGLLTIIFFAYCLIVLPLKTTLTNPKYLKKAKATIKDMKREDTFDEEGYLTGHRVKITCNLEYNNIQEEKELLYNEDYNELNIGDTINCIYNIKNNTLSTKKNIKAIRFFSVIILIVILFIILLITNAIHINEKTRNIITFLLTGIGCTYFGIRNLKTYYNIKTKKYIEINGTIINIHKKRDFDSEVAIYKYAPEIKYTYDGKEKFYISSYWSNNSKLNNIGDDYIIYYDKKTKKIYEKPNNLSGFIFLSFGIFLIIGMIIYSLK